MKKILSFIFVFFFAMTNAFADELFDIPADYWATKEIVYCIKEGIINEFPDTTYRPDIPVKRAEFNSMLLRTLGHQQIESGSNNKFNDIQDGYWAYSDILKSQRLGLLYGYPDTSFQPEKLITKTEVASIISHITKDAVSDVSILRKFVDASEIPSWGVKQYAKSIELGIYVNYPDASYLLPNKYLSRAEAAVILYRLRMGMGLVQEKYVAKETITGTQFLAVSEEAPNNKITVTNYRKIIQTGNVLPVSFVEDFNSKRSDEGKAVKFVFKEDLKTREGALLIPQGTTVAAKVSALQPQKAFNKNAKVQLKFSEITFPSGQSLPMNGRVFENNGVLTASKMATFGKLAGYTAGGVAAGAVMGVAGSAMADPHNYGTGMAIGLPVGAGVGLVTGLVTPGLAYKADEKDVVLILLDEDLSIADEADL